MAKIGTKRQRIGFERRGSSLDAFGQPIESWTSVATVWAEVRNMAGRELATARQVRPEVTTRITIRANEVADLTPEDRITFGTKVYQILSAIDPDERGREIYIDATEWVGAT